MEEERRCPVVQSACPAGDFRSTRQTFSPQPSCPVRASSRGFRFDSPVIFTTNKPVFSRWPELISRHLTISSPVRRLLRSNSPEKADSGHTSPDIHSPTLFLLLPPYCLPFTHQSSLTAPQTHQSLPRIRPVGANQMPHVHFQKTTAWWLFPSVGERPVTDPESPDFQMRIPEGA